MSGGTSGTGGSRRTHRGAREDARGLPFSFLLRAFCCVAAPVFGRVRERCLDGLNLQAGELTEEVEHRWSAFLLFASPPCLLFCRLPSVRLRERWGESV